MSQIPACCSWSPAAAPGGGRSLVPPGGCLSVYAPSPTAPCAVLIQPFHLSHRLLRRAWRWSQEIRRYQRSPLSNAKLRTTTDTVIPELLSCFWKLNINTVTCVQTVELWNYLLFIYIHFWQWHLIWANYIVIQNISGCDLLSLWEIIAGSSLPWWRCRGGGFHWWWWVVPIMVDFGRGRCRGFWGGNFLNVSIRPWGLGALLTEGLVEGAA